MSVGNMSEVRRDDDVQTLGVFRFFVPALGLLALVSTVLSWGALAYALQSLESVWQDRVEALAELHETSAPFYRILPQLSELGHPVAMDSAASALTMAREESVQAWKLYLGTTLTEAEISLVNRTTGPVAELHKSAAALGQILRAGDHTAFVNRMEVDFLPKLSVVAKRTEALVALQQTVTRSRVEEARRRHQLSRGFLIGSGVLAAIIVVVGIFPRGRPRVSP